MSEAGREISREEAQKMIEAGAQLVDVRADHEWEVGRIAGATHLPLAALADRAGEIDKDGRYKLSEEVRRTDATDAE